MRKISMKRKSKADLETTAPIDEDVENSEENGQDSSQENNNHSKKKGKKSKKGRKSNNTVESNGTEAKSDVDDEEQYEVETVLDQRTIKGVKQFLIRWKGYGSDSDTWEPESTLNCQDLIDKFLTSQKTPLKGKKRASQGTNSKSKTLKKEKAEESENEENEPAKKSPKKGKRGNDDSEGEYEVDRIIEVHHKKNGQREFLVHWKGYGATDNTWEPEENMSCPELIERFMAKVAKAKESNERELRVARKPTKHFTLSMTQSGRRLSRRNLGKQRAQYKETE